MTGADEALVAVKRLLAEPVSVRQGAIAQIAATPQKFGLPFFLYICDQDTDPICRWYAIQALGAIGHPSATDTLLRTLRGPDVTVGKSSLHRIAVSSLAACADQMVVPDLLDLLEAGGETAAAAADALGFFFPPTSDVLARLSDEVLTGEWAVALWAALSLARFGDNAVPELSRLLVLANDKRGALIIDALVKIGSTSAVTVLKAAVSTHGDAIRVWADRHPTESVRELLTTLVLQQAASQT